MFKGFVGQGRLEMTLALGGGDSGGKECFFEED